MLMKNLIKSSVNSFHKETTAMIIIMLIKYTIQSKYLHICTVLYPWRTLRLQLLPWIAFSDLFRSTQFLGYAINLYPFSD